MPGPSSYFTAEHLGDLTPEARELVERRSALGPAYRLFYENPIEIVRGEGTKLFDADDVEYLDAFNSVQSVGHAHPKVVDAIGGQAALVSTHTGYLHRGILDYAEDLLGTFPGELSTVMFTCTGSEANDLALRVVRAATNGKGIIVTRNAYHGSTAETAAISPSLGGISTIAGWVRVVDAPVGDGSDFVAAVASAAYELRDSEYGFAGFIVDSIFASDGIVTGTFLAAAADSVREAGGLVIADEVQAGFGRLGTGFWGFEAHGFVPDLVTLGKAMGNGMPIGAVVTKAELAEAFAARGRYVSSFGGNPVSIAAAQAVLDIVRDENLIEHAKSVGDYLQLGLALLASAHDELGRVRGSGLFIGVDVVGADGSPDGERALAVINELQRRHVLIGVTGLDNNVLKVRPPLPFSIADADRFLEQLYGALDATTPAAVIPAPVGVAAPELSEARVAEPAEGADDAVGSELDDDDLRWAPPRSAFEDASNAEDSGAGEPVDEEQRTEEPVAEEPVAEEEHGADEPVAEEHGTEEPAAEEEHGADEGAEEPDADDFVAEPEQERGSDGESAADAEPGGETATGPEGDDDEAVSSDDEPASESDQPSDENESEQSNPDETDTDETGTDGANADEANADETNTDETNADETDAAETTDVGDAHDDFTEEGGTEEGGTDESGTDETGTDERDTGDDAEESNDDDLPDDSADEDSDSDSDENSDENQDKRGKRKKRDE